MSNTKKLAGGVFGGLAIVVGVLLYILWGHAEGGDTARLGAVLVFIAALAGTLVSAIGLILKQQTEARLAAEREHNEHRLAQEHDDQQERLKLDAAMRAGELVASKGPSPAAAASGLLALTQLGQSDLAVALLVDLWSRGHAGVSNEIAIQVIDKALRSGSQAAQSIAAELLCLHSADLDASQSLQWPSAIDGCGISNLKPRPKLLLVEALIRMTVGNLPGETGAEKPATQASVRAVAVRLYGFWKDEPDVRVRGCLGKLINALIEALESFGYCDFMQGNQTVIFDDLAKAAASPEPKPDLYLSRMSTNIAKCLKEWADECTRTLPSGPGCLASGENQANVLIGSTGVVQVDRNHPI